MALVAPVAVVERPMSWRNFLELPDSKRAEYSEGVAITTPPPTFEHQEICQRIRDALKSDLGADTVVAVATGWVQPGAGWTRIPDLMVLTQAPVGGDVVTSPPAVVIEVLSSNRRDDLVAKSVEYHREGAEQYWIVDPRDRVIDIYARAASAWRHTHRLSDDTPSATISTAVGDVTLRLIDILH